VSFGDTLRADDVGLNSKISVRHPETNNWVTGKVVALTLMANGDHRIRLQLGSGYSFDYDARPDGPVIVDDAPIDYNL
jgi:hypothetical protein